MTSSRTSKGRVGPRGLPVAPGEPTPILVHICCGPCATHVLHVLQEAGYRPTGFFFNPNIFPKEEFYRRLEGAARVCARYRVALWVPPSPVSDWEARVQGLEAEPEGGRRCEVCIGNRLETTAQAAATVSIPVFATTLTIGPMKNSKKINELGEKHSERTGVAFLSVDFKKRNGFLNSVRLSKQMGLYRQNYCGCRFSMARRTDPGPAP